MKRNMYKHKVNKFLHIFKMQSVILFFLIFKSEHFSNFQNKLWIHLTESSAKQSVKLKVTFYCQCSKFKQILLKKTYCKLFIIWISTKANCLLWIQSNETSGMNCSFNCLFILFNFNFIYLIIHFILFWMAKKCVSSLYNDEMQMI